jgi:hypothetical protein
MFRRRLEQWLINRLPSRRLARESTVQVSDEGLHIRTPVLSRLARWGEVDRVVATKSAQFIGDTFILVFGFHDGTATMIDENNPAWRDVTDNLASRLPGAKNFPAWCVALAAGNGDVEVFRR